MIKIFKNKNAVGSVVESAVGLTFAVVIISVVLATLADPFSQEQMLSQKKLDAMASQVADLLVSRTGEDISGLPEWERHIVSLGQNDVNSISYIGLAPNPGRLSSDEGEVNVYVKSSVGNNPPGAPILDGPQYILIDSLMQLQPGVPPLGLGETYIYEYTAVSIDPDGDYLSYHFDWDVDELDQTVGYFPSGEACAVYYSFGNEVGTYNLQVRAIDMAGASSGWSYMTINVYDDEDDLPGPLVNPIPDDCCFPAGTLISMADGTKKTIEAINSGDLVLSYDVNTGVFVDSVVTNTIVKNREGVYDINKGIVSPTDDHPLYVKKADGRVGWAAVNPEKSTDVYFGRNPMSLEVGDELFTSDGWVRIESIEFRKGAIITYTFTVDDISHNYFANDVLASNAQPCEDPNMKPLCCFPAGTQITMDDGSLKNIEDVAVGDIVCSYDLENDIYVSRPVTDTIVRHRKEVYSINDGLLSPTDDHPLYVKKADGRVGWAAVNAEGSKVAYLNRDAMPLEVGDELFTSDGWIKIESIVCKPGDITTYTFTVDDVHNYFANDVLASNAQACGGGELSPVCCFPAGTQISMGNGIYKNIEDILIGDQVLSYNIDSENYVISNTTNLIKKLREGVYSINNGLIKPTDEHPLFVKKPGFGYSWAAVNQSKAKIAYEGKDILPLELGDMLFTENGLVEIKSIEFEEGPIQTYTFSVDLEEHNYLASGVLVSNPALGCNEVSCFSADTKIVMSDYVLKNIQDVEIQDKIKAFDEQTGEYVNDEIINVFHDSPDKMKDDYYLRINGKLEVTADHNLYIDGKWIKAGDLKIGDKFTDKNDVFSIEKIVQRIPTFNLDSKIYDNYIVSIDSDEFIIAHNDDVLKNAEEEQTSLLKDLATRNYILDGYSETAANQDLTKTAISKETIRQKYLVDTGKIQALSLKSSDLAFYESILKPSLKIGSDVEIAIIVNDGSETILSYQPAGTPNNANLVASHQRTALSYSSSTQTFGDVVTLEVILYQY